MAFVSYAQNFEDVMLWRALKHVENGRYIDIGASDPLVNSVSLAFHQHGWRGLHVEPIDVHADALRAARPGDVVLKVALGETKGTASFFVVSDGIGMSTCVSEIADSYSAAGLKVVQTSVPCVRLRDLFDEHVDGEVHWMKIDVEGFEGKVIRSWPPSPVRPWIVVVESTRPMTQIPAHTEWENELLGLGYRFAYFDGLNRFYISDAHPELAASFICGPNFFDQFVISPWSAMWQPRPETSPTRAAAKRTNNGLDFRVKPKMSIMRKVRREVARIGKKTRNFELRFLRTRRASRHPVQDKPVVSSSPSSPARVASSRVRLAFERLQIERRRAAPGLTEPTIQ